jgi:GNAT superfamily N-acetyltransferase
MVVKTTSENPDFQKLTRQFDDFLVEIDGDEKDFFAQYNQIYLDHVLIYYADGQAVGCGAFKPYEGDVAEIKRMFVLPEQRGKGIAGAIVNELEQWAKASGFNYCILETSNKLTSAISLYQRCGYIVIPNYGQYQGVASSVCMKKSIK